MGFRLTGLEPEKRSPDPEAGQKVLYSDVGEMLFTHFGISGPLVLSASAHMAELAPEDVQLLLDLKPGLTAEQLDVRLLRELDASGKRPAAHPF